MTPEELAGGIRPWLRPEHAPAFEAALDWLWPRCRTEEERCLAPALLLLLAPLNALIAPCRPVEGSCVNFQVTISRETPTGPERARLTVRAAKGVPAESPEQPNAPPRELWLDAAAAAIQPFNSAVQVLTALLDPEGAGGSTLNH